MRTDPNHPQTYKAGALLINGPRLTEIHDRFVVLERDGRTARLYVRGAGGMSSDPMLRPDNPRPTESNAQAALTNDSAQSGSASLTNYIRPNPVYDGQRLRGFELYPGSQSAAFAQMGLQLGDVITTVNGAPRAARCAMR